MSDKNTHIAVHAIQYIDEKTKKSVTVPAKSEFVAADVLKPDDIKALTESGAIRAVKRGKVAEADTSGLEAKKDGGTAHATGGQGNK